MTTAEDAQIGEVVAPLARGLAARLRDAAEAADRLAGFSFDGQCEQPPAPALAPGDEARTAHDFVLRVLVAAGDPVNFAVLDRAITADGVKLTRLAEELGLSSMALTERVHGLIQLGLLARDLQAGTVCATAAGTGVHALIRGLEGEVAEWLGKRRQR